MTSHAGIRRNGNVLEVRLNKPKVNAISGGFELAMARG